LIVEVESKPGSLPKVDHTRLLLQGATVVRFANGFLDAFKSEKNFVFIAIYIHSNGKVEFFRLFQIKGSRTVCRALYPSRVEC
jgi:hypothetical protein